MIMKRIFIVLIVLFSVISVMAQEHLSFKGIPIEGSISDFSRKLKSKGMTLTRKEGNYWFFSGDFIGRKATVLVATADGKNVFKVGTFFDPSREWNTLVDTYNYCKDLYTRKYGQPIAFREMNPSLSDSNIALMQEVYQGTVVYFSAWEVTGGTIELSIGKSSGLYEGMVAIIYRDAQNAEVKMQEDLNDI